MTGYYPLQIQDAVRDAISDAVQDGDELSYLHSLDPYLFFDAQTSMIGTLENPTLDLNPALPETLDVITATRAGAATYTDASGVIKSASPNTVRVDQTQGAELTPTKYQRVGYTDFSNPSQWSKSDATLTSGQLSPNGDNTATKLTATGNDPYIYKLINTSAQTHTFSFYCKGEGPTIGKTARLLFWYVGGATGTTESVNFTYSGEWQRFELQTTPTGAGTLVYRIDVPSDVGVVGESVYIWGPQLEEGTTASDFVANTTGSPKFITGATYGPRLPMILVEPSATNLVTHSEDFSNSDWSKTSFGTGVDPVVTANNAISPDGTQDATRVVFDTAGGTSSSEESFLTDTIPTATGDSYTESVYLKGAVGGETIIMRAAGGSNYTTLTLTTEWVRYEATETAIGTTAWFQIGLRQGLGGVVINPSITVYIWGAQLETGTVATSYIPTSGSTVTRAADDLVISGSAFSDFYNQSEGTFYIEGVPQNLTDDTIYWMDMSPSNERIAIYDGASSYNVKFLVENTSSTTAAYYPPNQLARLAISCKSNAQELSVNGGTSVTLTKSSLPSPTSLHIGSRYSLVNHLNGHIKRVIYWPYHSDSL